MERHNRAGGRAGRAARAGLCLMMAAVMAAGPGIPARGADSTVIESLSVTFKTTYGEPEEIPDPEITVSGAGCTLGDIQFHTDYDKWKPGKKVRADITVLADEGKLFPTSISRSKCKVKGAEFVSAKALDDVTLQVKVNYYPATVLGTTAEAGWSSSKRRAVWKPVDFAPGYSLVLYGNDKVVKRMTVTGKNSVNLSEFMNDVDKTYYYEVKAIPVTSDQKKYLKEGDFVTSSDQEFDDEDWESWNTDSSGGSTSGGNGTSSSPGGSSNRNGINGGPGVSTGDGGAIRGNNYILPDGRKDANTWKRVSDSWYYFDQNGEMVKGWLSLDGFWYYMNDKGEMQKGWVNPSGDAWYYLNENGNLSTGWIQPHPQEWYYLDGSGLMQRGWLQLDGTWYYLDGSGLMQRGWTEVAGKQYYLNSDGSMAANTTVEGRRLGADGAEY